MSVVTYDRAAFMGCEASTGARIFQERQLFEALISKTARLQGGP